MADTPTITRSAQVEADLSQIRTAVYGREVREAIANGIEHCYDDNQAAIGNANEAITAANTAARAANNAATAADQAKGRAENAAAAAENVNATASKVQDGPYQITVTNSQGTSATIEIPDPAAEIKKKANLEAVTVKKTVGPAEMVTFEDGVDAPAVLTQIKLEPKQDLHGYDHPWVGGAGKNLLPQYRNNTTISDTNFNWDDQGVLTISKLNSAAIRYDLIEGDGMLTLAAGDYILSGGMAGNPESNNIRIQLRRIQTSSVTDTIIAQCYPNQTSVNFTLSETTSFYPVLFVSQNTTAAAFPMVWKPMITLASETDQSYEPYSNVCPIEGYEEVTVHRTGTNLLSGSWRAGTSLTTVFSTDAPYNAGSTAGNAEWRIDQNGVITLNKDSSGQFATYVNTMLPELPAGVYYSKVIIDGITNDHANAFVWDLTTNSRAKRQNGNDCLTNYYRNQDALEFVVQEGHKYQLRLRGDNGYAVNGATFTPMLLISDSTNYVPPELGNTEIQITENDGIVYGGELTLNEDGSGSVVVDTFYILIDGVNRTFRRVMGSGTPNWMYTFSTNVPMKAGESWNAKSNLYYWQGSGIGNNNTTKGISVVSDGTIRVRLDEEMSLEDYNAFLSEHNLQVVFHMNEPTTYALTATQIQTLVGTNHVWTDAGEITLTYRSDKYAELERRLSQLEALVLES